MQLAGQFPDVSPGGLSGVLGATHTPPSQFVRLPQSGTLHSEESLQEAGQVLLVSGAVSGVDGEAQTPPTQAMRAPQAWLFKQSSSVVQEAGQVELLVSGSA